MKTTLSEISKELNRQSGYDHVPSVIFITDEHAQPYPEQIIENLPENSAVILRDYDHGSRADLGEALAYICKQKNIKFLVAKDLMLALQLGADGLHLPEFMMDQLEHIKKENPSLLITVSCHSKKAAIRAKEGGADAILLAPVFATKSHPETLNITGLVLGAAGIIDICAEIRIPVYALGGVNMDTASNLMHTGVAGIAAIRGFS